DAVMIRPLVKHVALLRPQAGIAMEKGCKMTVALGVFDVEPRLPAESLHHGVQRGSRLIGVFGGLGPFARLLGALRCRRSGAGTLVYLALRYQRRGQKEARQCPRKNLVHSISSCPVIPLPSSLFGCRWAPASRSTR